MGIGSGMNNTNKLKVLGFNEAMAIPEKHNWQASVDQEHERMQKMVFGKLLITATSLKALTSLTQCGH